MELFPIFVDETSILSVRYTDDQQDEFNRILIQWTDIEYLEDFFTQHEEDLKRPFWRGISVEQAILETRNEALQFYQQLKKLSEKPPSERIHYLSRLFKPLGKSEMESDFLNKRKVYGPRKKSWLRFYALQAGNDLYIITGGTIKLTDNMNEREHTRLELKKLETCKKFLLKSGICDEEGIITLLES